jgi:rSAM/selenodomain-associated transferase 1
MTLCNTPDFMPQPIIVVMAKAPRAGEVKTRLVPPLNNCQAASLAACFVRDTVLKALRIVEDVKIAFAPTDGRTDLEAILPSGLLWLEQHGHDLGERLESVAAHVSSLGFRPFIILGADSPTLPSIFIKAALEALQYGHAEISLGPTTDGGYYLVGLNRAAPGLFQNIDWSSPRVYQQTAANAAAMNLRLHSCPMYYDVDTPPDLYRLRDEITSEEMRKRAPGTYQWFMNHALPSS